MTPFHFDQVTALAPDTASVKAAKSLVNTQKWMLLAHDEHAVWGLCQGSGSKPYQTAVDMSEPAFKCSCPSRKFPCKHGLALLYLLAQHTDAFQTAEPPEWVAEWLEKRGKTAAAKAAKAENATTDPVAQQKRQDARLKKAHDGLADLRIWLDDVIRNGLISWKQDAYQRCHDMARRMIDAQMPAVAAALHQLADTPAERQDVLLHRLTKLSLLEQAFQHRDTLPETWQAEILARLGFPIAKETVLAHPPVMDVWRHIGTTVQDMERGEVHTHWLYGSGSGRFACILDFVIQGAPSAGFSVLYNGVYTGELCFYQGVQSLRALSKTWELVDDAPPLISGSLNVAQAWEQAHTAYADNPFLIQYPMKIDGVRLWQNGTQWALSDGESVLPFDLSEPQMMKLLAHTAGSVFTAFALYHFELGTIQLLAASDDSGSLKVLA